MERAAGSGGDSPKKILRRPDRAKAPTAGAAPAAAARNRGTGALRVTVRPDYEGLPPEGWTWQGERDERPALEALTKPARVAEVTVPERKIAARERREASALRQGRGRLARRPADRRFAKGCFASTRAPPGAPLPSREGKEKRASPRLPKNRGGGALALCRHSGSRAQRGCPESMRPRNCSQRNHIE